MDIDGKARGKARPNLKSTPVRVPIETAAATLPEALGAKEPIIVEAAAEPALAVVSAPEPKEASSEPFDPSAWPLKTLGLLNENVAAAVDFVTALARAKSLDDAMELQTRFASERCSAFLRHGDELAELARRAVLETPFRAFGAFAGE